MKTVFILLSILSSLSLYGALDSIQKTDWEENTEKAGQWYVEEEEPKSSQESDKAKIEETMSPAEEEINSPGGETETNLENE